MSDTVERAAPLTASEAQRMVERYRTSEEEPSEIARVFRVSVETLYRHVRRAKAYRQNRTAYL